MLFKTIEEFLEYVPVNNSLKLKTITPDIKRVERKFLKPYLGTAQYEALNTAYNSVSPVITPHQEALLKYAQEAVALFTISQALPILQIQVSDAGLKSHTSDTEKDTAQWKVDALSEEYCLKQGWETLDEMMKFLQTNAANYPLWTADTTASTIAKQFIINTSTEFNKYYWINDSPLTYKALEPSMRNALLFDFNSSPGADMMTRIMAEILSGTISAHVEALMKWLKPMFAHAVIARGIKELYITVRPDGVFLNNYKTTDSQNNRERLAVTQAQAQYAAEAYTQVCSYGNAMLEFLQANATSSVYPEFFNSTLYVPAEEEDTLSFLNCEDESKKRKFFRIG